MLRRFKFLIVMVLLIVLSATPLMASNMTSTNYRLIFGTLNSGGGKVSGSGKTLNTSLGQVAASRFSQGDVVVKAGFQYIRTLYPFTFRVTPATVPLGTLVPNTPSTGTVQNIVTTRSQGFDVFVQAETPMKRVLAADTIADTLCDGGIGDPCTTTTAKQWTSSSTYGFGYGVTGQDMAADFINTNYYRQFPAQSQSESSAVFMTSIYAGKARTANVNIKANIDGQQAAGTYQTILRFIAVPKY